MNDLIGNYLNSNQIRDITIFSDVVGAFLVGPYLAFAATSDAGVRCFQAFVRLIHRIVLIAFAIALMNNAMVIAGSERVPSGSAVGISIGIVVSAIISAMRYYFWMGDIPADASWGSPHFAARKTDKQASDEVSARRIARSGG